eukprot:424628_1
MGMTVVQTRRRNSLQKEENSLLIENENSNLKRARKSEGFKENQDLSPPVGQDGSILERINLIRRDSVKRQVQLAADLGLSPIVVQEKTRVWKPRGEVKTRTRNVRQPLKLRQSRRITRGGAMEVLVSLGDEDDVKDEEDIRIGVATVTNLNALSDPPNISYRDVKEILPNKGGRMPTMMEWVGTGTRIGKSNFSYYYRGEYNMPDSETCHWCRQKLTKACCPLSKCSTCSGPHGKICGACLEVRFGENLCTLPENWSCPYCREICNCSGRSCTRWRLGLGATGVVRHGMHANFDPDLDLPFESAAHVLILHGHRNDWGFDRAVEALEEALKAKSAEELSKLVRTTDKMGLSNTPVIERTFRLIGAEPQREQSPLFRFGHSTTVVINRLKSLVKEANIVLATGK